MASQVVGVPVQNLECSFCLEVLEDATLLSCGHTFCRRCLEAYDEQHRHDHGDHIVCPVCRERTKLGKKRIAGLTSNFLALGIQDELHVVSPSQSFCPLHRNVHNDIFCEDCKDFICLTCFIDSHKDHKIIKKEALGEYLRKKRDSLMNKSEMTKAQIEESVNNAEQHSIDTCSHVSKLEQEIEDEFAKRVTVLRKMKQSLVKEADSIRKETINQLEGCIANKRQTIEDINNSNTILRGYTENNVDSDAIKTQYLQSSELEKSLKRSMNEASIVRLKQRAESTRFRPSDEKLLALGHIEVEVKEPSNIQQVKTPALTNRKSEQLQTRRKVAVIPPPSSNSLKIVRQVEAPERIWEMAALSHEAVVVGYGWTRPGSDRFSVSGEQTKHLKSVVGNVYDIAFLTDGRSVVSHGSNLLRVYSTDGQSTNMQCTCKGGHSFLSCNRLCVDQDDNIYFVNGNPEIYIFHGSNLNQQGVIPTGDIKPRRICVTKTGALITLSCRNSFNILDTVTMFDREGDVGSSITASDNLEYLYATMDSQDRVLVARVRSGSYVFRLTRYTVQGTTLNQQVSFNELKLPYTFDVYYSYCCMTSLEPKLIAFAHGNHMYFIELSE